MFNRQFYSTKAQVTLFVIVGLVILSVSAVIVSVNRSVVELQLESDFSKNAVSSATGGDLNTMKQYFETVSQLASLYSLEDLAENGGIIYNVSGFNYSKLGIYYNSTLNYSNHNVLYYLLDYQYNNFSKQNPWNTSAYPCFKARLSNECVFPQSLLPTRPVYGEYNYNSVKLENNQYSISNLLSLSISQRMNSMLDYNYINRSYIIEKLSNISVVVTFNDRISNNQDYSYVDVLLDFNMRLIDKATGEVYDAGNYELKIPAKYSSMYKLAKFMHDMEPYNLTFNSQNDYRPNLNYANFDVRILNNVNSRGDAVYELFDDSFTYYDRHNFTYRFAVRNRPPVLKYVPYLSNADKYFFVESGSNFTMNFSAIDPDDEDFFFEISEVTPDFGTSPMTATVFRQKANFDSRGTMRLNTSGLEGVYNFTVRANDGVDYDYQSFTLIVNDIPKVNFTMRNGFYWDASLDVNPDSTYNYTVYPFFTAPIPNSVYSYYDTEMYPPTTRNVDKNSVLYIPCKNLDGSYRDEGVVPADEYVKLLANYSDVFNKGGYTFEWTYVCNDGGTDMDDPIHISSCTNKKECFAKITCPGRNNVFINLKMSDGLSEVTETHNYDYKSCLSCRPCCMDNNMMASPDDFCDFSKYTGFALPLQGIFESELDTISSGKYYYGDPSMDCRFPIYKLISSEFQANKIFNAIKYDETNHETGVAPIETSSQIYYESFFTGSTWDYPDSSSAASAILGTSVKSQCLVLRKPFVYDNANDKAHYGKFYDQKNMAPMSGCFVTKDASFADYTQENFKTGYLYYQLKCNGYNSFCDPKNLWFGNYKHELAPALYVFGISQRRDSTDCMNYKDGGESLN